MKPTSIKQLFLKDIDRKIDGVIKVEKTGEEIRQEVEEYVITTELRRHFITFFEAYRKAFDKPSDDIGVWLSGFFGSGKSHFLKMLSYILSNKEIGDKRVVDAFREKFDDPAFFMTVEECTKGETETILFNIDIQASGVRSDAAVLRVFSKMFYNHLGYHGDNLKVVRLEKLIETEGKTEEFRRVFEEERGWKWEEGRKGLSLHRDAVVKTMVKVLGISKETALGWFSERDAEEESIQTLVDDIQAYVAAKPKNYRLLFMVDEVGQYVGEDTNMLLKLQDIVEAIGSRCGGKVWVVCTAQSAIDEIKHVKENAFSRIQARFHIRMDLSSSSVDEVIQKRLLSKTPDAERLLKELYGTHEAVLRNTFTFREASSEVKGYASEGAFIADYPFVPYQFAVLQKVFAEIRKHGNAGAHMAGGERSMISGFQESVIKIEDETPGALVPFFRFYDTVCTFLDHTIRRVIDRAAKLAEEKTLDPYDVSLLKLLYLIRYLKEVPASLGNLIIMMTERIGQDKEELRKRTQGALDRLLRNDFIAERENRYYFLTDDEQDIRRRINATEVNMSAVVKNLGDKLFEDIYTFRKFRHKASGNDYDYNRYVDTQARGSAGTHPLTLRFLTSATPDEDKTLLALQSKSSAERSVIVVLKETPYYDTMREVLQVRAFARGADAQTETPSVRDIIEKHVARAAKMGTEVTDLLRQAVSMADIYVAGDRFQTKETDPVGRLNDAMEQLVGLVFSKRDFIDSPVADDSALQTLLTTPTLSPDMQPNARAMDAVAEQVEVWEARHARLTVQDLHSLFSAAPYGWSENDIAGVVAQLLAAQRINIKTPDGFVTPTSPGVLQALRRRTAGKAVVTPRRKVDSRKVEEVRAFAKDAFHTPDIPSTEDALKQELANRFGNLAERYGRCLHPGYPGQETVQNALERLKDLHQRQTDGIAYFDAVIDAKDALLDMVEDMEEVMEFFGGPQRQIFDEATALSRRMKLDADHLSSSSALTRALAELRGIIDPAATPFRYARLSCTTELMRTIEAEHELLLNAARDTVRTQVDKGMSGLRTHAGTPQAQDILAAAEGFFKQLLDTLPGRNSISQVISLQLVIRNQLEEYIKQLMHAELPAVRPNGSSKTKPRVRVARREELAPPRTLQSDAEVDAYVEEIRAKLLDMLKDNDAVSLQ